MEELIHQVAGFHRQFRINAIEVMAAGGSLVDLVFEALPGHLEGGDQMLHLGDAHGDVAGIAWISEGLANLATWVTGERCRYSLSSVAAVPALSAMVSGIDFR